MNYKEKQKYLHSVVDAMYFEHSQVKLIAMLHIQRGEFKKAVDTLIMYQSGLYLQYSKGASSEVKKLLSNNANNSITILKEIKSRL